MDKKYLKQLAKEAIGTNFFFDEMTEEELAKDPIYQAKLKMKDLDEEEKSFVLKEQKKILASPLKMLLLNIKRNKPL